MVPLKPVMASIFNRDLRLLKDLVERETPR
jgi:hypothetical protein